MTIELSVVVPTRNGSHTIEQTIRSVIDQDARVIWELIVVDNGSTDDTRAVAERVLANSRVPWSVLDAASRPGPSAARNRGVAASRGAHIAFLDDDDVAGEGWLDAIHAALSRTALVASRLEYRRLNSPGALVGRREFQGQRIENVYGHPGATSAGMGVRRETWSAVSGFDESLLFAEDHDFVIRVRQTTGATPAFVAEAIYHYRVRPTFSATFKQFVGYGRGHVITVERHGAPAEVLRS